MKRRTRQLIVPYLIWTLIAAIISAKVAFVGQFLHCLLYPSSGYWFLYVLWVVTLLMYLSLAISEVCHLKDEWPSLIFAIVMIGSEAVLKTKMLAFHLISYYFVFYIIGYYYRKYENQLIASKPYMIIIGLCIWFVLASFWNMESVPFFLKNISFVPESVMNLLYRFITAIVGIWLLLNIANRYLDSSTWLNSRFVYFGKISIGIYVSHMIIGPYVNILISAYTCVSITVNILLSFVVTAILSFAIMGIMEKNSFSSKYLLGKI